LICFVFISVNAQQSDNNDQPLPTDVPKNTYVADPAKSDNGDVAPAGHVSKNTYVADSANSDNGDGVQKVNAPKADDKKAISKPSNTAKEAAKTTEVDLAAPTVETTKEVKTYVRDRSTDGTIYLDGSVKNAPQQDATSVTSVIDADQDGQADNASVTPTAKTYTRDRSMNGLEGSGSAKKASQPEAATIEKDADQDGQIDTPASTKKAKVYVRDRKTSGVKTGNSSSNQKNN